MGISRYFGSHRPRAAHLVTPGGTSGEILDLRNDIDEAFVDIETALGTTVTAPAASRYVDLNAAAGGSGTQSRPYQTIQAAIDDLEAIGGFSGVNPAAIYIEGGVYNEAVVVSRPGICLIGKGMNSFRSSAVRIDPADPDLCSLTITNATRASLEAYNLSGNYGDLVSQGDAGPQGCTFANLDLDNSAALNFSSLRTLGVVGDVSPTQTAFGGNLIFFNCRMNSQGITDDISIYSRNTGYMSFSYCIMIRAHKLINCYAVGCFWCFAPGIDILYDATDPFGEHQFALYSLYILNNSVCDSRKPNICDGGAFSFYGCTLGGLTTYSTDITLRNAASARLKGCSGEANFDVDGDSDLDMVGCTTVGDVTIASGPGTATWDGGGWTGELTDPDGKLTRVPDKLYKASNSRYVDLNSTHPDPDGSFQAPYLTIQTAIDDLEAIGGFSDANPASIYIEGGVYNEAVVILRPGINFIGKGMQTFRSSAVKIDPADPDLCPLTITNATRASLEAYNLSGNYGDLVSQGDAGPKGVTFANMDIDNSAGANFPSIRILGVAGDVSPTETSFGENIYFYNCRAVYFGITDNVSVYARNSAWVSFNFCTILGVYRYINCYTPIFNWCFCPSGEGLYDPTDSFGENIYSGGTTFFYAQFCIVESRFPAVLDSIGSYGQAVFYNCTFGAIGSQFSNIQVLNDAAIRMIGCSGLLNTDIGGDSDLTVDGSNIVGDVSLASGPGTAEWDGGGWTGELTDPDNKLSRVPDKLYRPDNVRYVSNQSTHPDPDGSPQAPYLTIQAAIDDLEAIGGFSETNPAVIYVESGVYNESLVVHQDGFALRASFQKKRSPGGVVLDSADPDLSPLTLTNATPASLAAYDISGDYGDLVNQGDAGPRTFTMSGFSLGSYDSSRNAPPVRSLGVAGDISPTQTDFGYTFDFDECELIWATNNNRLAGYFRNTGNITFTRSSIYGYQEFINCSRPSYSWCYAPSVVFSRDAADPLGESQWAQYGMLLMHDSVLYGGSVTQTTIDGAPFTSKIVNCTSHSTGTSFDITTLNGANLVMRGIDSLIDLDIGGDCDLTFDGGTLNGDVTLQSGPGVASWDGGGWTGELTDLDNKLSRVPDKLYLPAQARYVDVNGTHPDPDGSFQAPYTTIQEAIDDLEAIGGFGYVAHGLYNSAMIYVEPGIYYESLVLRQDGICFAGRGLVGGWGGSVTVRSPDSELPSMTITNATAESLALYNASGDYGDLVNQGDAGPRGISFYGINFSKELSVNVPALRILGVAGDVNPTETAFCTGASFTRCYVFNGNQYSQSIYVRNAGWVGFSSSTILGSARIINSASQSFFDGFSPSIHTSFDATDPMGKHASASANSGPAVVNSSIDARATNQTRVDGSKLVFRGSFLSYYGTMSITVENGGQLELKDTNGRADIIVDGDSDMSMYGCTVDGDVTLASGPSTASWEGGGWTGELADPDGKLSRVPDKLYLPAQARYVDVNGTHPDPDGSFQAPYTTIQAAIDDLEAIGGFGYVAPGLYNSAMIYAEPGIYYESLVLRQDGICFVGRGLVGGWGGSVTVRSPDSELPSMTITNATAESLALYSASGDYGDLVNQGDAGPRASSIMGFNFNKELSVDVPSLRLLGVAGDVSATETAFCESIDFIKCYVVNGNQYQQSIYARNVGYASFTLSTILGSARSINSSAFGFWNGFAPSVHTSFDAADPMGKHAWASANGGATVVNCSIDSRATNQTRVDGSTLKFRGSFLSHYGTMSITAENGGQLELRDSNGRADIIVDGDSDMSMYGCTVDGDVSLASGPGTALWEGDGWTGELTDPDGKLSRVPDKLYKAFATRYVDLNGTHPDPDGSFQAPYTAIQEAIDDLEAIGGFSAANPAVIYVESGTYNESLVVHQNGFALSARTKIGDGPGAVVIDPGDLDLPSLTLTNATPASLAAYDISDDYADLVNQGDAGPESFSMLGFALGNYSANVSPLRLLGVAGDVSPTQTAFGTSCTFDLCRLLWAQNSNRISGYFRNAGYVGFTRSSIFGYHRVINCTWIDYWQCFAPTVHFTYDPLDPFGEHQSASFGTVRYALSTLDDRASVQTILDNVPRQSRFLACEVYYENGLSITTLNGSELQIRALNGILDLDIGGDCDLVASGCSIDGDITLNSGAGIATWNGGSWTGALTDPDDKLALTPPKRFTYPASTTIAVTALIGQRVRYNTSGGTFQIDAPASPNTGDSFAVKEIANDATNVTVSGNGNNVEHPTTGVVAATAVFGQARIGVTWEYDGTDWIIP